MVAIGYVVLKGKEHSLHETRKTETVDGQVNCRLGLCVCGGGNISCVYSVYTNGSRLKEYDKHIPEMSTVILI